MVEYYPPPAHAQSGQGPHQLPAVVRVAAYVDINEVRKCGMGRFVWKM